MNEVVHGGLPEPFFLPAAPGERFCIYYPSVGTPRGGVVYLHPFAEEMNKSRRMAAVQSRLLSARGYAVLQIDLYGCGDSSGDFGEANWEIWQQDVVAGFQWLRQRAEGEVMLWGLRLGALLALDAASLCDPAPKGYLLWQPVISGERFLTQFLRLRVATGMIANGVAQTSTGNLRRELKGGNVLEVAGYDLAPQLAFAIDSLDFTRLAPDAGPVHWLELVPEAGRPLSPASLRVTEAWISKGIEVNARAIVGEPFWNTVEIAECPTLLAETTRLVAGTFE